MKHGYVRAAALTPVIRVADCEYNTQQVLEGMKEAFAKKAKVAVFPEMCLTGYTCNDLFLQEVLINGALEGLEKLVASSKEMPGMVNVVGLPFTYAGKLYNVAAVFCGGKWGLCRRNSCQTTVNFMKEDSSHRVLKRV